MAQLSSAWRHSTVASQPREANTSWSNNTARQRNQGTRNQGTWYLVLDHHNWSLKQRPRKVVSSLDWTSWLSLRDSRECLLRGRSLDDRLIRAVEEEDQEGGGVRVQTLYLSPHRFGLKTILAASRNCIYISCFKEKESEKGGSSNNEKLLVSWVLSVEYWTGSYKF